MVWGIKFYDLFNVGFVVLGVVEEDDFIVGWEVFDIVLEILLFVFVVGWFLECNDVCVLWIEVFVELFDCVVFVSGVVVFEN